DNTTSDEEALIEIYKRLRPGEPPTVESAQALLYNLFFDPKRYDLAKVGRYKFNKKLSLYSRIVDKVAANNIINLETGEILVEAGEKISREKAIEIENSGINKVDIVTENGKTVRVIGNNF